MKNKTNISGRIIALLLTVSLLFATSACTDKNTKNTDTSQTSVSTTQKKEKPVVKPSETTDNTSEATSESSTSSATSAIKTTKATGNKKRPVPNKAPQVKKFINRKAYYEYNDAKLNSLIDKIKKINCTSRLDMDKYVKEELNALNSAGYFDRDNVFPDKTYSWFKNGTINVDALSKKLAANNIAGGSPVTNQIREYIQATAEAAKNDYEFLKRNYPEYKASYLLHKLNSLKVGITDNPELMGSYKREQDTIVFNPDNLQNGRDDIMITAGHELFHVGLEINETDYVIYQCGTSIDALSNINTALDLTFMSENYADSMSYEALGFSDSVNYYTELEYINFIASSCVVEREVLRKAFVYHDNNKLIDIFEPEMQDYIKIMSAFSYANSACGYAAFNGVVFDAPLLDDCRENFFIFIVKNYYINQLKRYYFDEIDKEELMSLLQFFNSFSEDFDVNNDNIKKLLNQMQSIVLSCK